MLKCCSEFVCRPLLFQLMLIIGLAHALVVFRVVAAPLLSEGSWDFIKDHANTVAVMMGAVLHYLTIQVMTRVCLRVSWRRRQQQQPPAVSKTSLLTVKSE